VCRSRAGRDAGLAARDAGLAAPRRRRRGVTSPAARRGVSSDALDLASWGFDSRRPGFTMVPLKRNYRCYPARWRAALARACRSARSIPLVSASGARRRGGGRDRTTAVSATGGGRLSGRRLESGVCCRSAGREREGRVGRRTPKNASALGSSASLELSRIGAGGEGTLAPVRGGGSRRDVSRPTTWGMNGGHCGGGAGGGRGVAAVGAWRPGVSRRRGGARRRRRRRRSTRQHGP
jgi:hypothetical protein